MKVLCLQLHVLLSVFMYLRVDEVNECRHRWAVQLAARSQHVTRDRASCCPRRHLKQRRGGGTYFNHFSGKGGPGSVVGIATGQSGVRIPVEGEIFRTCPDRPWGPPSVLYNGYRVFPGGKERSRRDADPSPPPSSAVVMK